MHQENYCLPYYLRWLRTNQEIFRRTVNGGVILHLIFKTVQLFFLICRNPAICRYPKGICSSYKRKGQAKCPGVRIPDEIIKGWNLIFLSLSSVRSNPKKADAHDCTPVASKAIHDKNGEKHYSYTSESAL